MKFTFSPKFRLKLYARLLRELAEELDTYRVISGTNMKEMMVALNISHPILKKY